MKFLLQSPLVFITIMLATLLEMSCTKDDGTLTPITSNPMIETSEVVKPEIRTEKKWKDWIINGNYPGTSSKLKAVYISGTNTDTFNYIYKVGKLYSISSSKFVGILNSSDSLVNGIRYSNGRTSGILNYTYDPSGYWTKTLEGNTEQGKKYIRKVKLTSQNNSVSNIRVELNWENSGRQVYEYNFTNNVSTNELYAKVNFSELTFATPTNYTYEAKWKKDMRGNITEVYEKRLSENWLLKNKITYDNHHQDEGFTASLILDVVRRKVLDPFLGNGDRIINPLQGSIYRYSLPVSDVLYYFFDCAGNKLDAPVEGNKIYYTYSFDQKGLPIAGTIQLDETGFCKKDKILIRWQAKYE